MKKRKQALIFILMTISLTSILYINFRYSTNMSNLPIIGNIDDSLLNPSDSKFTNWMRRIGNLLLMLFEKLFLLSIENIADLAKELISICSNIIKPN